MVGRWANDDLGNGNAIVFRDCGTMLLGDTREHVGTRRRYIEGHVGHDEWVGWSLLHPGLWRATEPGADVDQSPFALFLEGRILHREHAHKHLALNRPVGDAMYVL